METSIIVKLLNEKCGFVTIVELPLIIEENKNQMLLARCGNGRFLVFASDAEFFINLIEKKEVVKEYIRIVPLVGNMARILFPNEKYIVCNNNDVEHFINVFKGKEIDYIRDISIKI